MLVFAGSIDGAFVYDDTRQIEDNPLVLEEGRFWEAMNSDVWAFRAEAGQPGSNYWRPTFVAWMIANHRLFGLNPAGWHVANILLHTIVVSLLFLFLIRLGLSRYAAGGIALVFGVHPVHVESVSWIAGSPDLLLGIALFGTLLLVCSYMEQGEAWKWIAAVLLSLVGMGAKEIGIMVPFLIFCLVYLFGQKSEKYDSGSPGSSHFVRAVATSAPFFAAAGLYFFARLSVIGGFSQNGDSTHGLLEAILTIPAVSVFYLRQVFLPFELGPIYELEPVFVETLSLENFWVPLLILVAVLGLFIWLAKRSSVRIFGLVFAALLLLPAFNIGAFPIDHIVHDRYLYLPLLGILMIVLPSAVEWLASWRRRIEMQASRMVALICVVLAVPLAVASFSYGKVWESDLALWKHGTEVSPRSAFGLQMYGAALENAGRSSEAIETLDRSLNTRATAPAVVNRADALIRSGRGAQAIDLLMTSIEQRPDYHPAFERLALIYRQQNRLGEAEEILRQGREHNAEVFCALSANLGVILYLQDKKEAALEVLEEGSERADQEATATCRHGLFHLGELYRERGDSGNALAAYERFLLLTETLNDGRTAQFRQVASQRLAALQQ